MSAIENNITNQLHPYHPFKDSIKANGHDWSNISKLVWSNVLCKDILPNLKNAYSGFELFNKTSKINAKSYFNLLSQKEQIDYLLGISDDETLDSIKLVSGFTDNGDELDEYILTILQNPESKYYSTLSSILEQLKIDFVGSDDVGVKVPTQKKYKQKKNNMEAKFKLFEINKSNYPDTFFDNYISVFWNICKTNNTNEFLTNIYKSFILGKHSKAFVDELILTNNLNLIYIDTFVFPTSINNEPPIFPEDKNILKQKFLQLSLGKNASNNTNNTIIGKQLEDLRTYIKDDQFKQIQKNEIITIEHKQHVYYAYQILETIIKNRDIEIYLNKTIDEIIDIYQNTKKIYTNKGVYYLYNCSTIDIQTIQNLKNFIIKNKKTVNVVFEPNFLLENVDKDLIIYKTEKKDPDGNIYYEYYYNEDEIILPDLSIDYIYKNNIGHFKEILAMPETQIAKYIRDKRISSLIGSLVNKQDDFILKVVVKYLLLHNKNKPLTDKCKANLGKIIENEILKMKIKNQYIKLRNEIKNLKKLEYLELPNSTGNIKKYVNDYISSLNLNIPKLPEKTSVKEQTELTAKDLLSSKSPIVSSISEADNIDKSISKELSSKPELIIKTRQLITTIDKSITIEKKIKGVTKTKHPVTTKEVYNIIYSTVEYTDSTTILDIKIDLEHLNSKWKKDYITLYKNDNSNITVYKNDCKIKNIITQHNNVLYLKKKSLLDYIEPPDQIEYLNISNKNHIEEPNEEFRGRKEKGDDLLAPTANINFIFNYKIFPTVFHCLIYKWFDYFELENPYLFLLKSNILNILQYLENSVVEKDQLLGKVNKIKDPLLKDIKDTLIVSINESQSDIDKNKILLYIVRNPASFKTPQSLYDTFVKQENLWINNKLKKSLKYFYYKQIKNNIEISQYFLNTNIDTLQFTDINDPYIASNSVNALIDIKKEVRKGLTISKSGIVYLQNQISSMRKLYVILSRNLSISDDEFLPNKIYYRIIEHIYNLRIIKCGTQKEIILSTNIYNKLSKSVNKFLKGKIEDRNYNLLQEKLWKYVAICAQTFKKPKESINQVCMENIESYKDETITDQEQISANENLDIFLNALEKNLEKDLRKISKTKKIIPEFDIVDNIEVQEVKKLLFEGKYKNYFIKYFS